MLYPMFSLILWRTVSWPPASFWKIYPFTEMVVRGVVWCDQGITFPCLSHMPYLTYRLVNMDASQVWNSLRSVYLHLPNDIVHQAHSSCHACTIKSEILFNYRILKKPMETSKQLDGLYKGTGSTDTIYINEMKPYAQLEVKIIWNKDTHLH